MKIIWGILGGMGAYAGLRLAKHAFDYAVELGAKTDSDFPQVILYNLPVRGMNETGVIDSGDFVDDVLDGLYTLDCAGCRYVVMACNTAHCYFKAFEGALTEFDALINMISVTVGSLKPYKKVGVLSSASTKAAGLYENEMIEHGIEPVLTTDEEQKLIDAAIASVIESRQNIDHFKRMDEIVQSMLSRGAERVVIGCTELPLVTNGWHHCIDAGEVTIRHVMNLLR